MTALAAALVPGFEYGNARVRAMAGRLLAPPALLSLTGFDPDGLASALRETAYRADIDAAATRGRGLAAIQAALAARLARTLALLRSFYDAESGRALDLALARDEEAALLAVLRGQARQVSPEEALALAAPAGALDATTLHAIAHEPGLRAAIDLLAWRGLPFPGAARALVRALVEGRRAGADAGAGGPSGAAGSSGAAGDAGRLTAVEHALAQAYAARLDEGLAALDAPDVAAALRAEVDRRNALSALRARPATAAGAEALALPGGRVRRAVVVEAARAETPAAAARILAEGAGRDPGLAAALLRHAAQQDADALARDLDRLARRDAAGMLARGDPLGPAVPVGYARLLEAEVRDLRVIARGAALGLPAGAVTADVAALAASGA